ncbi:MAG: RNA-binding domain-containing protein [Methanocellales archaeon]
MIVSISLRGIAHATEDIEKVKRAIQNLARGELALKEIQMQGHFGNPIVVLYSSIEGKKACEQFFKNLKARLSSEDYQRLKKELPHRVDSDCYLYLRFDKQALFENQIELACGEDAVALKAKVKVYPAKYESALEVVRGIFS